MSVICFAQSGAKDQALLREKLADKKKPITWVITGDSITHGAWFTEGGRSYPEHLAERVRGELLRFRDFVINTGVSGEISTGLLKDFDWRVLRFTPDVVSINLGMNDCMRVPLAQYQKEMAEMITKAKAAGAIVILQATNTVYTTDNHAKKLPAFIEAVRALAKEHDVMLVDHYKYFSDHQQGAEKKTWLSDAIHPNALGHAHMAAEMFRAIGIYDAESDTCKLAK